MTLTRRGRVLVLVVVVGSAMAWLFGARSLNAIVAPALVALLASVYWLRRVDEPSIERHSPDSGFVGETRSIEFDVSAAGPLPATLVDRLGDGLSPVDDGNAIDVILPAESVVYEVTFDRRGAHELGPVSIEMTDPLGLVRRSFTTGEPTTAVVYPPIYELTTARLQFDLLPEGTTLRDRQEFDQLREYERGDSLRDVHWKSTAKQPADELIVRQFTADTDAGDVIVAGECSQDSADEMAAAVASVAFALLSTGVTVGVTVADGAVPVDAGSDHRHRILDLLARTSGGPLDHDDRATAVILITTTGEVVEVAVDDESIPFRRFLDTSVSASRGNIGRGRRAAPRRHNRTIPGRHGRATSDGGRPS